VFDEYDALSFDCYGTLIDWEAGIAAILGPWARRFDPASSDERVLTAYADEEARIVRERPTTLYPDVLADAFRATGAKLGYPVTDAEAERLGSSVPEWPAFPDSHDALVSLADRFELIILSNVDNASFEGSRRRLDGDFDHIITAQDVGNPTSLRHATRRGWILRPTWLRLVRQAANSRAVAALLPRLQCGHRMVTVRASSSTATVSSAAQSRHQRCRVTGLT
jgi:2-haloalkanoic acid dehalogenase type II